MDDPLAGREAALWDRQERLWAREMARWDAERAASDARERALLAALASLQTELTRVTALLPGGDAAAAAVAAAATPAPAAEVHRAPAAPLSEPAAPARAAAPTFADHLAAAKAAVENGDVLADELGGHGELLGRGAAAPPPAAAPVPPPPPPPPPPAAAPPSSRPPWEVTPPTLAQGSDDLFWVNALQNGPDAAALHCGDDEAKDFYFGPGTCAALETFQAIAGLPETGVADMDTWRALLGDALNDLRPPDADVVAAADAVAAARAAPPPPPSPPVPPPPGDSVMVETWSEHRVTMEPGPHGVRVTETEVDAAAVIVTRSPPRAAWPILREGDGGRHVHELQVALNRAGFHCGDDDEQWWQFGDATYSALLTFQACSSLPESGVVDAATWVALLGPDATPEDGAALSAGDGTDDDMLGHQHDGAVYLVGEQRWARKAEAPPDR